ncbi:MAG: ECF-type sigma factor [Deltaproteobacteria bacterium]
MRPQEEITVLLQKAREGDAAAGEALLPIVYEQLRQLAAAKMRKQSDGHTLQPTALVHEAYMRALGNMEDFENRRHFFFVASRAMRDILVDHARKKSASKRGGDQVFVSNEDIAIGIESTADDMLALDQALTKLEGLSQRQHDLVMLRFFGGLTSPEAAKALDISERTAERDWRFARAYLHKTLSEANV